MPTKFRYLEGEDGDCTNFGVSLLVKRISCACGCIFNNTWSSISIARRRRYRSPNIIFNKKVARFREKLQYNWKRRFGHGIFIAEVQTLFVGPTFQYVYESLCS
jgi:hypothetical protein